MANLNLLKEISWIVVSPPRETAAIGEDENITDEQWQQVILPGRDFILRYPITGYPEQTVKVLYQTEGQPVTLLDLLSSIQEFYAEDLTDEVRAEVLAIDPNALEIADYEIVNDRGDLLGMRNIFEGLVQVGPNEYQVDLAT